MAWCGPEKMPRGAAVMQQCWQLLCPKSKAPLIARLGGGAVQGRATEWWEAGHCRREERHPGASTVQLAIAEGAAGELSRAVLGVKHEGCCSIKDGAGLDEVKSLSFSRANWEEGRRGRAATKRTKRKARPGGWQAPAMEGRTYLS